MTKNVSDDNEKTEYWKNLLDTGEITKERRIRNLFARLPDDPRCKLCNSPYQGLGAPFMRILGRTPSNLTPNLCKWCVEYTSRHQGGAEVVISMVFADIRGSTTLAENMSASDFRHLINHFYQASTKVLIKWEAVIDRLVGDQAIGYFIPGLAGQDHARKAINSGKDLLRVTGHSETEDPWIPLGVGVHTGTAFVGTVGTEGGVTDFTALGDAVNTGARLASVAAQGELLVSEEAYTSAGVSVKGLEERILELKGRSESTRVRVFLS